MLSGKGNLPLGDIPKCTVAALISFRHIKSLSNLDQRGFTSFSQVLHMD